MSEKDIKVEAQIRELLGNQQLAVLSTRQDGQPYSSLMAFAFRQDLKELVVATAECTRKHQNMIDEPRVSLLVDNRTNSADDFKNAAALTILGNAFTIPADEKEEYQNLYLARHPDLEEFILSSKTSMIKIQVDSYLLVSQFQKVKEYSFI